MKKIIILILSLFCLCGCTNINKSDIPTLVNQTITSNLKLSNQYRKGYKYYLPHDLSVYDIKNLNEVLQDDNYKYYMYVDLISYYNKVINDYEVNKSAYYSQSILYNNKFGYLEINVKNDKYLIEIMYNYAKIEVIVDKDDINKAVTNSLIVLSTIKYNKDIIKNMMDEDILSFNEETFSIFNTNGKDSNFLEYVQEYGNYEGTDDNDEVHDYDLVN
jgi:hypothetical protein